jgi:hypothetical protein
MSEDDYDSGIIQMIVWGTVNVLMIIYTIVLFIYTRKFRRLEILSDVYKNIQIRKI